MEIGDTLDLHTFLPSEVRDVTMEYLRCARDAGFSEVRIIHGKGKGVQKEMVRMIAAATPWITAIQDGGLSGGGWGASVLTIEPIKSDGSKNQASVTYTYRD